MSIGQVVPLTSAPRQTLSVQLQVDGNSLTLRLGVNFSEIAGYWVLTISDNNGVLILDSIPMICGSYPAANILAQYGYLAIGSCYIVNAGNVAMDSPNASNLGSDFLMVWSDTAP